MANSNFNYKGRLYFSGGGEGEGKGNDQAKWRIEGGRGEEGGFGE